MYLFNGIGSTIFVGKERTIFYFQKEILKIHLEIQ